MISDIHELPFSKTVLDTLQDMGISTLYPPQSEALEHILKGKNLVMSVPTASGKSLIAYLAILRGLAEGGKGLYIVPLRALASEKFEDLTTLLPKGYSTIMSIGDYEETDKGIMKNDVIIATSEKADSLFRHRPDFLKEFSVVVADEVHLITDPGRGHIMEVLLTRLKQVSPDTQLVALSATIPNSREIADWLDAAHLKSDWRPISLKEGVFQGGKLRFHENDKKQERTIGRGDPVKTLVGDGLDMGGQSLVFVNTRKSAEAEARKLIPTTRSFVDAEKVGKIFEMLVTTQEEPTDLVSRLADCVEGGCGFHHAGLGNNQRKIVEKAFKMGYLKALVATPTLAAGINLPARRVIIRDLTRYGGKHAGTQPIANLELKQMAGRAGRPGYDPFGEAIFITRKPEEVQRIFQEVIHGETEKIESKLGVAPILRVHIISSIASNYVKSYAELMEFLNMTFYAMQFGIRESEVREAIGFLHEHGMIVAPFIHPSISSTSEFVTADTLRQNGDQMLSEQLREKSGAKGTDKKGEKIEQGVKVEKGEKIEEGEKIEQGMKAEKGEKIEHWEKVEKGEKMEKNGTNGDILQMHATPFGKLISDLYIDPKSAVIMKRALENSPGKCASPLSYLHTISAAPDMLTLYAREGEMGDLLMMAEHCNDELFLSPMDNLVYGNNQGLAHEIYAEELKTALLLKRWIDEVDENSIMKTFNIGPGDLRSRVDTARWLLHALERIAALFHHEQHELKKLVRRIVYGVKEELLPLVDLKGIGRVKARILYKAGYTDISSLKRAEVQDLLNLDGIGKGTVLRMMDQLGRDMSEYEEVDQEIIKLQRSLLDFGI